MPEVNDDKGELKERITRDLKDAVNAQKEWREEARRCYRFVAGDQYDEEDVLVAQELRRPLIVFNRVGPVVDAVTGMECGNRHEIRFIPTENSDAATNDLLTDAVRWASGRAFEPQQTSAAFKDMVVCGLGVTATRLDYEEDPDGKICVERIDPLGYFWDAAASGRNALDRRWDATVKLVDHEELEAMFGEDALAGLTLEDDVWKDMLDESPGIHNADLSRAYTQNSVGGSKRERVPLVEYEYYKREPYYRVAYPGGMEDIDYAEFRRQKAALDEAGVRYVRQTRRRFYRVFLAGNIILEESPAPDRGQFSRTVMTGKRDEDMASWYGMVRPMIGTGDSQGPQQMTNKLYSSAIDSISTQGKGGLLAETDAFEDPRQAEDQWAASDSIIWMRPGGLAKQMPKPLGEYPNGMDRLLQWATQSIPEVTGVSWELLGLVNRDQPGILEEKRKESAITILADYFDALKLYRHVLGRLLANLVIEYMAGDDPQNSQLIRLSGKGSDQLVPLLKDQLTMKFDVLVDDSPASANQKDRTWAVLVDLLPMAMQLGMPPPANWIEYAPIPSTLAQEWAQQAMQAQQGGQQPDPLTQRLLAGEAAKAESAAELNKAKTQESVAKAGQIMVEAQLAPRELQLRTFESVQAATGQQHGMQMSEREMAERQRQQAMAPDDDAE